MTDRASIKLNSKAKNRFDALKGLEGLTQTQKLEKLIDEHENPVSSEQCDQYHFSGELFNLLNELTEHELTTYTGKPKDAQKLIDDKLRELIETSIERKRKGNDRWPDARCPFRKKLDDLSGQCLKDTPEKRYSITASDCWACLQRNKMKKMEGRISPYQPNGIEPYKAAPVCDCPKLIGVNHCSIDNRVCDFSHCDQYRWMKKGVNRS